MNCCSRLNLIELPNQMQLVHWPSIACRSGIRVSNEASLWCYSHHQATWMIILCTTMNDKLDKLITSVVWTLNKQTKFVLHEEKFNLEWIAKIYFIFILNSWRIKTKFNPSRPIPRRREKINLNFHFHTSLWFLKGFMKASKFRLIFILLETS